MTQIKDHDGNWIYVTDCKVDEDGFLARFTFEDNGISKELIVTRGKKGMMYYLGLLGTTIGGAGLLGVFATPLIIPGAILGLIGFLKSQGEGYYDIKTRKRERKFPKPIHTKNTRVYRSY